MQKIKGIHVVLGELQEGGESMEDSSIEWGNLSLKSKFMMNYIKKLGERLDKEHKVEQILGCFNLHGQMVVRLVTLEFGDYALVWWTQMEFRDPYEGWVALKRLMRGRFFSPSYTRDLHNKLHRSYKGSRSMKESI
ncbi:hypothetical protein CR513_19483, partial [Mucuna pruriens]